VLKQKVDMASARGGGVDEVGVEIGQGGVEANKLPARARGTSRKARDEEQLIRAGSEGKGEVGGKRSGCRSKRRINGDRRKRVHRSEGRKGAGAGRVNEQTGLCGASGVARSG
jgi:hypothetical protein